MVALWVVVGAWGVGEIVLQLVQRLRSDATTSVEWGSYGGIVLTAAAGLLLATPIRRAIPAWDFPARTSGWLIAIVLLVALGAGFRFWAIITLGRYFRAVVHIQEGHRVVRSGPYRVLRHPSYTGLLIATLGVALLLGNIASAVLFEVLVIAGVLYRIRVEEKVLSGALGTDYTDYMRVTKRLIPGVW